MFSDVPNGNHRITVEAMGLAPRTLDFSVSPGGQDVQLPQTTLKPGVLLVSTGGASTSQAGITVDFLLWVEGDQAVTREIESVQYCHLPG